MSGRDLVIVRRLKAHSSEQTVCPDVQGPLVFEKEAITHQAPTARIDHRATKSDQLCLVTASRSYEAKGCEVPYIDHLWWVTHLMFDSFYRFLMRTETAIPVSFTTANVLTAGSLSECKFSDTD